jgi:hypothetical protein
MKSHRIRLLVGGLLTAAVVLSAAFFALNSVRATSVDEPSAVLAELQAAGVDATNVNFRLAEQRVEVIVKEGSGDAWAITVVPRLMGYLKQSASVSANLLDITIVDGSGETTYQSSDDPIEASRPPAATSVAPDSLREFVPQLQTLAEQGGVAMADLAPSNSPFGLIVELRATITETAGVEQDNQVRYVVFQVLPKLRDLSEKVAGLNPALYRIAMVTPTGETLVDYVVDPVSRTVNAWAPTVGPVWASDRTPPRLKKSPSSTDQ